MKIIRNFEPFVTIKKVSVEPRFSGKIRRRGRWSAGESLDPGSAAGYMLLEVLISLFIIAVVLVAVYRMHSQTIMMNLSANFYMTAPLLAGGKMAEIEAAFPEVPIDGSGDFDDAYPGYRWKITVSNVDSEDLDEVANDIKQIDLAVLFNDGERILNLRTFRLIR